MNTVAIVLFSFALAAAEVTPEDVVEIAKVRDELSDVYSRLKDAEPITNAKQLSERFSMLLLVGNADLASALICNYIDLGFDKNKKYTTDRKTQILERLKDTIDKMGPSMMMIHNDLALRYSVDLKKIINDTYWKILMKK